MRIWRKEFSEEEISFVLEKIRDQRTVSPDGSVSISNSGPDDLDRWTSFLLSAIDISARSNSMRMKIVRNAIFSSELGTNFTEKDFRRIVYRLKNKYEAQDISHFRVVFPVWNLPTYILGTKKTSGFLINFSPSTRTQIFRKITEERLSQTSKRGMKEFFSEEKLIDLRKCSIVSVYLPANNPGEAHERASEAIYEILGLINLVLDFGKSWRMSFRSRGKFPVSTVLIAPHITVHKKNGELAYDGFWYENWRQCPNEWCRSAGRVA